MTSIHTSLIAMLAVFLQNIEKNIQDRYDVSLYLHITIDEHYKNFIVYISLH